MKLRPLLSVITVLLVALVIARLTGLLPPPFKLDGTDSPFSIRVDQSNVDALVARGRYEMVSPGLDSTHFPSPPNHEYYTHLHLVRMDHATKQEALDELERRGLKPASVFELLSFGEQYHTFLFDDRRAYQITALGSIIKLDDYLGKEFAQTMINPGHGAAFKQDVWLQPADGQWETGKYQGFPDRINMFAGVPK